MDRKRLESIEVGRGRGSPRGFGRDPIKDRYLTGATFNPPPPPSLPPSPARAREEAAAREATTKKKGGKEREKKRNVGGFRALPGPAPSLPRPRLPARSLPHVSDSVPSPFPPRGISSLPPSSLGRQRRKRGRERSLFPPAREPSPAGPAGAPPTSATHERESGGGGGGGGGDASATSVETCSADPLPPPLPPRPPPHRPTRGEGGC